ncbi:hypothetical protein GCK72_012418 [Caenorhabditis remanei]|uniref:Delta-like protein n=1 Tax=Caenorhabditis remanei TaxID=31234 RepID=A0A6A5GN39_CAERE|nr:hypothetical protein GCK72_012418 [Caenorhabditis remanei]KAF1755965.1 hypothetical protein GCK72_012418 [Caenorhabditis remanei]
MANFLKFSSSDIDNATITATFTPRRGIFSPLTVMYPFTGIKINIGCDTQYYGDQCNVFCCSETASRVGKECNSLGQLGCPVGKKGLDCKQSISKKWGKCKNKGSCISSFGKNLHERIQCSCPVGFTGIQCEKEVPSVEMMSVYGVDPKKFEIGTAKMLYESVVDNEMVEVSDQIIRTAEAPKEDKLVIHFANGPADATDAQAAFSSLTSAGTVIIPMSATL